MNVKLTDTAKYYLLSKCLNDAFKEDGQTFFPSGALCDKGFINFHGINNPFSTVRIKLHNPHLVDFLSPSQERVYCQKLSEFGF